MEANSGNYSPLRWLVASILLLCVFSHSLLWSAPSPLLTVIVADLRINLSQGGLLISIICLMVTAMGLSFDSLRKFISARELFTLGLLLMAIGQLLLLLADSFGVALVFRILAGLGMGVCMPVYAVLVMANFPSAERPLINTIYAALPYAASVLCFTITVPLYQACHSSWRLTMASFGGVMLLLALLWWACRRQIRTPERGQANDEAGTLPKAEGAARGRMDGAGSAARDAGCASNAVASVRDVSGAISAGSAAQDTGCASDAVASVRDVSGAVSAGSAARGRMDGAATQRGLLRQVMANRQVRLLMVADVCDLWGYNFLCSFLPTYFTEECGYTMAAASTLTSVFSLTGLFAGLLCGFWMSKVGLRKPFTWPMHLLIFLGTLLVAWGNGPWRVVGLVMAGFGNAGWAPALFTIPMEFKGMDPIKTGVAYSFIFSIGYIGAFVSPLLGGAIGDAYSLRTALVVFSLVALLAAYVTFRLDETGPGRAAAGAKVNG